MWKGTVTHWGHRFHKAVGSKRSGLVVCLLMELSCVGFALPLLCWIAASGDPSQKFCQNLWYTKPESGLLLPRPSGPNIHLIKMGSDGLSIKDKTKFWGPGKKQYHMILNYNKYIVHWHVRCIWLNSYEKSSAGFQILLTAKLLFIINYSSRGIKTHRISYKSWSRLSIDQSGQGAV